MYTSDNTADSPAHHINYIFYYIYIKWLSLFHACNFVIWRNFKNIQAYLRLSNFQSHFLFFTANKPILSNQRKMRTVNLPVGFQSNLFLNYNYKLNCLFDTIGHNLFKFQFFVSVYYCIFMYSSFNIHQHLQKYLYYIHSIRIRYWEAAFYQMMSDELTKYFSIVRSIRFLIVELHNRLLLPKLALDKNCQSEKNFYWKIRIKKN